MLGDRWGVTEAEVGLRFGCDEVVPEAQIQLWRGVSIDAPAPVVWRWVRQVRLAPYSYDLIDNMGRRSPRRLTDLRDPQPGDHFTSLGGRFDVGRVISAEPGRQLTARIMGATMSYLVLPQETGSRLLLKIAIPRRRWRSSLLAIGDWPMARRQLLNFKRLAEAEEQA